MHTGSILFIIKYIVAAQVPHVCHLGLVVMVKMPNAQQPGRLWYVIVHCIFQKDINVRSTCEVALATL